MTDSQHSSLIRLGFVGMGKIARDQHLPPSQGLLLPACGGGSRHAGVDGVASFEDIEAMLADGPMVDAVSICTPLRGTAKRHRSRCDRRWQACND